MIEKVSVGLVSLLGRVGWNEELHGVFEQWRLET